MSISRIIASLLALSLFAPACAVSDEQVDDAEEALGEPCDDGNPFTSNDTWNGVSCAGHFANEGSSLGVNMPADRYYINDYPFVDLVKLSRPWFSGSATVWQDARALDLDPQGWVKSLLADQVARTQMFSVPAGSYPSGRYIVKYEGHGTLVYGGAATKNAALSTDGREVIDVDATRNGGIQITLTAVTANDHLRNLHVTMPGGVCSNDPLRWCDDSNVCSSGGTCGLFEDNHATQVFHPTFLDRMKTHGVVRFMQWMNTNDTSGQGSEPIVDWDLRPKKDDPRWAHGVPLEVMIGLANKLHARPWFTLPHLAGDAYMASFAAQLHAQLAPDLKPYIEYSNEVWNGGFPQAMYAQQQGLALGLSSNAFQAQLRFYSQRSVQMFGIFQAEYGGLGQFERVLATQHVSSWASNQILDWQSAHQHADALATAPYFYVRTQSQAEADHVASLTIDQLMDEIQNVSLPIALDGGSGGSAAGVTQQKAVAQAHGLPLIAYEGGPDILALGAGQNNATINALFDQASRHPRMKQILLDYLNGWKTRGGGLYTHFKSTAAIQRTDRCGSLEYLTQPRAQAPKFDALQTFIETTPRWW